ncbi:MAG: acyltransferase family protein, partial [Acidimicrobiales bacterium]|nr:acyltransferase family protein [Acidimicrobiales bacterium]
WFSLKVELCINAALPVVARTYLRRPLAWCSGIVIFTLAIRVFTFSDLAPRLGERPLRVLAVVAENLVGFGGHFAVGMIAAVLLVRGPTATIRRHSRLILAAGVVTCIGGAWVTGRNNMDASLGIAVDPMVPAVTRPIFAIGFAAVVLVIASQNLLRSGLGGGPMKWIGDRSYGLYLLHPAVIYLLEAQTALLAPRPPSTFVFVRGVVIAVPLSIAVGALTFRYIEVPAVRWARHSERDRESTRE